jgi:hypothetical protein
MWCMLKEIERPKDAHRSRDCGIQYAAASADCGFINRRRAQSRQRSAISTPILPAISPNRKQLLDGLLAIFATICAARLGKI